MDEKKSMTGPRRDIGDLTARKRCTKCGELKPLSEFWRESRSPSGYRAQCKDCSKKEARQLLAQNRANEEQSRPPQRAERWGGMTEVSDDGFRAIVGERTIVHRRGVFRDGERYFEGESAVFEGERLTYVIRYAEREGATTSPVLIDGSGEHRITDLALPPDGERERYYDAIYRYVLESILLSTPVLPLIEFQVFGRECISKTVRPVPGAGRVNTPKSWIGSSVLLIR